MIFYKSWLIRYLAAGHVFSPGLKPSEIEATVSSLDDRVGELRTENKRLRDAKKNSIALSAAEIQSGLTRVRWAELLIQQLPEDHEGRNSWLMNYGTDNAKPEPGRKYLREPVAEHTARGAIEPTRRLVSRVLVRTDLSVEPDASPEGPEDPVNPKVVCYCGMSKTGHTKGMPDWGEQR